VVGTRGLCVAAALALSGATAGVAAAKDDAARYAKDVDFLLETFEKKAGHFFAVKKVDWKKVAKEFRADAKKVSSDAEHLRLCVRLVARLRDGHAGIVDSKVPWPDESKGRRFTGPRVHLLTVGERVYVSEAFGEAAERGVAIGMEVAEVDGTPAREWLAKKVAERSDTTGFSTDHQALYDACHWGLADWEGTKVSFALRDGKETKTVEIERNGGPNFAPSGPLVPPNDLKTVGRQSYGKTAGGFGYVHLRDVPDDLPAQLDTILAAIGDVPGLVLDMRANGGGGCDHEAVFGRFLEAGKAWKQYVGAGARPYTGPMVVIVDAGVRSAGETVAGQFKEDGRAYMIGEGPTAGTSSQKEQVTVPSGLFTVRFSVGSNKKRFNGGRGIEGIGVPPHEVVPYDPAELRKGVDTQIRRAEELLKSGFPKGKVAYQPPSKR
jgi:carboxyl-terminal processing protease